MMMMMMMRCLGMSPLWLYNDERLFMEASYTLFPMHDAMKLSKQSNATLFLWESRMLLTTCQEHVVFTTKLKESKSVKSVKTASSVKFAVDSLYAPLTS